MIEIASGIFVKEAAMSQGVINKLKGMANRGAIEKVRKGKPVSEVLTKQHRVLNGLADRERARVVNETNASMQNGLAEYEAFKKQLFNKNKK